MKKAKIKKYKDAKEKIKIPNKVKEKMKKCR